MDEPDAVKKIRFLMVGREIGDAYYREDYDSSHRPEVALKLDHISLGPIKDFSLELHKGEIIGFGGLSGCGMHEIGRAAFGLEKLAEGHVYCGDKEIKSCLDAIENGIGYISKNRDTEALILEGSIAENIVLPSINALSKRRKGCPTARSTTSASSATAASSGSTPSPAATNRRSPSPNGPPRSPTC